MSDEMVLVPKVRLEELLELERAVEAATAPPSLEDRFNGFRRARAKEDEERRG